MKKISTVLYMRYWPNISTNDPDPGSGSKGVDPVFLLFFKDNKAHNVHDKDVHYQNSITKPHTRS